MDQPSPAVVSEIGGGRASARGSSVMDNSYAYDGVKATSPIFNLQPAGMVDEAVEEAQVVSGALRAELGDLGGAYVNVVSKSGGNDFHFCSLRCIRTRRHGRSSLLGGARPAPTPALRGIGP